MAIIIEERYDQVDIEMARIAKALGHPARVAILKLLSMGDGLTCSEIVAHMPLSQSTVSQHLLELKTAGLVTGQEKGPSVVYKLRSKGLDKAEKHFKKLFKNL